MRSIVRSVVGSECSPEFAANGRLELGPSSGARFFGRGGRLSECGLVVESKSREVSVGAFGGETAVPAQTLRPFCAQRLFLGCTAVLEVLQSSFVSSRCRAELVGCTRCEPRREPHSRIWGLTTSGPVYGERHTLATRPSVTRHQT